MLEAIEAECSEQDSDEEAQYIKSQIQKYPAIIQRYCVVTIILIVVVFVSPPFPRDLALTRVKRVQMHDGLIELLSPHNVAYKLKFEKLFSRVNKM